MPFVRITVTPAPSPAAQQRLATGTTRLMADVLGKKATLTSVLVETATAHWTIGGEPAPMAAHLEALVTTGTNSAEQKAAFLAQAMALLSAELGVLPTATYVVVRDVPAEDWGYGGLSQAARR
ncbi:MAG: tautomerase family protein [Rhodospirillaceae bacterium]|nr:tautomerase family protein [Rhodospirillales bacterium]